MPENNDYLNQVSASGSTYDVHDVRVPEVTASNNGKILKVLNGSWGMADESTFSIPTVTVAASQFSGTYPLYQIQLTTEQKAIVANTDNKFLNLNLSAVETLSRLNTLQISRVATGEMNTTISKFIATVMAVISPETNEDETVNGEPAAPFRLAWNYDSSDADYLYLQVYKLARADQVVHYTQSDEKEDWEKETARTNIGAAPLVPTIAVKDCTSITYDPLVLQLTSDQKSIVENENYTSIRFDFGDTLLSGYGVVQAQIALRHLLNSNESNDISPDIIFETTSHDEVSIMITGVSYLLSGSRYINITFNYLAPYSLVDTVSTLSSTVANKEDKTRISFRNDSTQYYTEKHTVTVTTDGVTSTFNLVGYGTIS